MNKNIKFYAEYDEESTMYGVFDSETGKCYNLYCELKLAEDRAEEMNK